MTKFCKVYMNTELIELEKDLDEGRQIGLYAWGRVTQSNKNGKVQLIPTNYVFDDVSESNILVRERKDVTWLGDPITRKRYPNEIDQTEKLLKLEDEKAGL